MDFLQLLSEGRSAEFFLVMCVCQDSQFCIVNENNETITGVTFEQTQHEHEMICVGGGGFIMDSLHFKSILQVTKCIILRTHSSGTSFYFSRVEYCVFIPKLSLTYCRECIPQ